MWILKETDTSVSIELESHETKDYAYGILSKHFPDKEFFLVFLFVFLSGFLFAFLFGTLYLKESPYPQRMIGALGICLGLVLIRIY